MKTFLRLLVGFFVFLLLLAFATLTLVDRTPPVEQAHYSKMMTRLDSLNGNMETIAPSLITVGWSRISITPDSTMALAGYGARKPKTFDQVMDSVYIRTLVIHTGSKKVALLSADLLIIHPEVTQIFHELLKSIGWNDNDVYLMATHTHSSIGQWASGLVGSLFAGEYEARVARVLAERMISGILRAQDTLRIATMTFTTSENPDLVTNRLVGKQGIEDPFLKNLMFKTSDGSAIFSAFSAHASCLTSQSRQLSADFPGYFHRKLAADLSISFSLYAAGPVASMGPEVPNMDQYERTLHLGGTLADRVTFEDDSDSDSLVVRAFRIPLELGKPQFKITKNLCLRPYLFELAFGDILSEISVLQLGKTLLIGTPCDFSGELAMPLYDFARLHGLELIITSFNGGYIGYVTRDEWYDLEKYETRTMNWYGPGNGLYFSEIIKKIVLAMK